jgi:hypothetical protein
MVAGGGVVVVVDVVDGGAAAVDDVLLEVDGAVVGGAAPSLPAEQATAARIATSAAARPAGTATHRAVTGW